MMQQEWKRNKGYNSERKGKKQVITDPEHFKRFVEEYGRSRWTVCTRDALQRNLRKEEKIPKR